MSSAPWGGKQRRCEVPNPGLGHGELVRARELSTGRMDLASGPRASDSPGSHVELKCNAHLAWFRVPLGAASGTGCSLESTRKLEHGAGSGQGQGVLARRGAVVEVVGVVHDSIDCRLGQSVEAGERLRKCSQVGSCRATAATAEVVVLARRTTNLGRNAKAHGSIGHPGDGNIARVQRTWQWTKALRSGIRAWMSGEESSDSDPAKPDGGC